MVICDFHDEYLRTVHPDPPPDSKENVRSDETNFVQGLNNQHPSNYDWSTIMERIKNWREDFDSVQAAIEHFGHTQYCKQINAVERHRCSAYRSTVRHYGSENGVILVMENDQ